jgi:hypothetical protein
MKEVMEEEEVMEDKNKRAQSEMIAYVLLIVIALAISAGVYAWLKFYVPSQNQESCSEEIAIAITDYSCNNETKVLSLNVENKGYFNIKGFFARVSNDSKKIPVNMLYPLNPSGITIAGRYDFENDFISGQSNWTRFLYNITDSAKRVQLQPYIVGSKGQLVSCQRIVDINLEGNGC